MESKVYTYWLTETDRARMLRALRKASKVGATLADRIERERGEDDLLSLATSRLRAWYYRRVRDLADEALAKMLDGTLTDTGGLDRWLSESIDGTDLVVYTYKAKACLLASDNDDAAEERFGASEGTSTEARAFCAIEADVRELLECYARTGSDGEGTPLPDGFDLYDADTWTARPDDADDGEDEVSR